LIVNHPDVVSPAALTREERRTYPVKTGITKGLLISEEGDAMIF
jgi:hypothetical protein